MMCSFLSGLHSGHSQCCYILSTFPQLNTCYVYNGMCHLCSLQTAVGCTSYLVLLIVIVSKAGHSIPYACIMHELKTQGMSTIIAHACNRVKHTQHLHLLAVNVQVCMYTVSALCISDTCVVTLAQHLCESTCTLLYYGEKLIGHDSYMYILEESFIWG